MSIERRLAYFRCFSYAPCLQASLIMHVPISELHAQWPKSQTLPFKKIRND